MTENNQHEQLFQGLVISLASAAMQHMGKTLNPFTQKIEKNLDAAQSTIDMLDMLVAKTTGNLSDAEGRMIRGLVADLKLNYVDAMKEKPAEEAPAAPAVEGADAPAPSSDAPAEG